MGHADVFGLWSAKKTRAKVFCTMHNIYFNKNFLDNLIFKFYSFLFLKKVTKTQVISISKSVEMHVIKKLKLPGKRSHILVNAIPFKIIEKEKSNQNQINLLFVGRLEPQKSVITLLDAIQLLKKEQLSKSFILNIVGDGSLKEELENKVDELEINELVKFEGKKTEVDSFYQKADIFILPSIWEGFGIVLLEAFRAKNATIATNIEGPAELINHNVNGLLFSPENHIELAKNIQLLVENENLRNQIAQKGFETFSKKYEINNYVKKLEGIYING